MKIYNKLGNAVTMYVYIVKFDDKANQKIGMIIELINYSVFRTFYVYLILSARGHNVATAIDGNDDLANLKTTYLI